MNKVIFLISLVFGLVVNSWGTCKFRNISSGYIASGTGALYPADLCSATCPEVPLCVIENGPVSVAKGGEASFSCPTDRVTVSGACTQGGSICGITCRYSCCTEKCEADSIRCVRAGDWWDSANCSCSSICGTLESKCIRAGGRFTGRALNLGGGQACCSAICDQCNTEANEKIVELKKKYCCEAGFAPPAEGDNCYSPPGISGCGMTTLQRMTSTLDYQCRDPNSSEEAANAYYDQCFPGSSSSGEGGGSSSSGEGGGSSSSGEGGSSSGGSNYPDGCDECPWLDSILDTLTLLKWNSDDILQCIVNPSVCSTSPEETETSQIDTVIFEGIKERLDSVVAGLRSNDLSLLKIDTSILRLLDSVSRSIKLDSFLSVEGLKNDTLTRRSINSFSESVTENLLKVRNTVDTNLVKLRNGVFELDTGMKHHLDSIIAHLPDTIFDSIRKYQDSTLDRIDTALFGAGVGFSLVDSMIDTVVKYFKVSNHYDSVYNSMFASFDSTFKYKMENLEMSIESDYSALGYGDTATSTLRSDLSDFKNSVSDGFESLKSSLGYGDTATSTLRSDLSDFKNSVLGAIASFDSSVSSEISDLLGVFSPGAIDSGSVGYGSGFVAEGERFGDSLARAVGWLGGLDGVNVDSVFAHAGFDSLSVDSVGRAVDDSLSGLADSLNGVLVAQNDSIKRGLPDSLDVWADSLRAYSPFASFDSLIFGQLGAKIPNSNQCPEDCNKWSIDLPRFGLFNFTIDYGLCLGRVPLGGMNALAFIRLLLRIVVVWSCIWIVFNALTRRKD